jgi:putative glutamine amidotransferase
LTRSTGSTAGVILLSASTEEWAIPYVEVLTSLGVPRASIQVLTPSSRVHVHDLASRARGIVLSGGIDVDPARYGEAILPGAGVEVSRERDQLEWDLVDLAIERRLPVWGVCRGLQVLNVHLGGTLWQDLPSQLPSGIDHSQRETPDLLAHPVEVIAPGAPLAERLIGEAGAVRVNSRHHQAIRRAAEGLVPVALSPDGLIEAAVLDRDDWWVRGVQWHPENLVALEVQRELWIDFLQAAGFETNDSP